jgi:hypothetical protein
MDVVGFVCALFFLEINAFFLLFSYGKPNSEEDYRAQGVCNLGGLCSLLFASLICFPLGREFGILALSINTLIFSVIIYKQRKAIRNTK